METWAIVGLGNPGREYAGTRHNIGFLVIDELVKFLGHPPTRSEFKGELTRSTWNQFTILTIKPMTYMNLSGECVQKAHQFYKVPLSHLLVIHDEIDMDFGQIKLQKNRGHGGHNGIRSISGHLGSADYYRLRMGVGRPNHPNFSVADYVLQNFSPKEYNELPPFLDRGAKACEALLINGYEKASTEFNKSQSPSTK